jgi:N-acetylglutamate synthase-like GNAT family acetyltransferase
MLSHGIEVVNLEIAQCLEMMEEYKSNNRELWDGFLAELNPDLFKPSNSSISIRHHLLPGDIGYITYLHAVLYAPEQGWDHTFDSCVAIPLAQFALRQSPQERIWIAEKEGRIVGCVAIVKISENIAQLRWLLLHPEVRGLGLGRKLVQDALHFCREAGYSTVFLWTVSMLPAAVGLYRSVGFRETENVTHEIWGSLVTEVRYELELCRYPSLDHNKNQENSEDYM